MIEKIKRILLTPKEGWAAVEAENEPHAKVFTSYLLPLALIPTIAAFIGYGLIGYSVLGVHVHSISFGVRQAIVQFITMTGGAYLTAFVIYLLADTFGAAKNFDKAFSLVVYAYTPTMVAGVFNILPSLSIIGQLAGIYSLYLLYIGLAPMMKAPAEKQTSYFVVSLVCMVGVFFVIGLVLAAVLIRGAYGAALGM